MSYLEIMEKCLNSSKRIYEEDTPVIPRADFIPTERYIELLNKYESLKRAYFKDMSNAVDIIEKQEKHGAFLLEQVEGRDKIIESNFNIIDNWRDDYDKLYDSYRKLDNRPIPHILFKLFF